MWTSLRISLLQEQIGPKVSYRGTEARYLLTSLDWLLSAIRVAELLFCSHFSPLMSVQTRIDFPGALIHPGRHRETCWHRPPSLVPISCRVKSHSIKREGGDNGRIFVHRPFYMGFWHERERGELCRFRAGWERKRVRQCRCLMQIAGIRPLCREPICHPYKQYLIIEKKFKLENKYF